MSSIGLAPFIAKVRDEVREAMVNRPDQDWIEFRVKSIELEVQVVATEEKGSEGGFDLKVFKLGGSMGEAHGRTHTVKLVLDAKLTSGREPMDVPVSRSTR